MSPMNAPSTVAPAVTPICIVGAGMAALIHAYVLFQDGFTDITLITRDRSVGGTWARQRVYPGLKTNNLDNEYRFSVLDPPPRPRSANVDPRPTGVELRDYFERFWKEKLEGKVKCRFETEVLKVERPSVGQWLVYTEDCSEAPKTPGTSSCETLIFSKLIMATGRCSKPKIPPSLSHEAAREVGFEGTVIHSSEFGPKLAEILKSVQPQLAPSDKVAEMHKIAGENEEEDFVLVVGCGKSAMDISTILTGEGRKVVMVYGKARAFVASDKPTNSIFRRSRFLSAISPYKHLDTHLERFLHTTWLGNILVRAAWGKVDKKSSKAAGLSPGHPLWPKNSTLDGISIGDTYLPPSDNTTFYSLANSGAIRLIPGVHVSGYADDGHGVVLNNKSVLRPKAIVFCTGYESTWTSLFDDTLIEELGLKKRLVGSDLSQAWNYPTLDHQTPLQPHEKSETMAIHRGLVPVKNLPCRDFAIAGGVFTIRLCYTTEIAAHWVSSYFLGQGLRLPSSIEEADDMADEQAEWDRRRFPKLPGPLNDEYNATRIEFFTWSQYADELLADMGLPSASSGQGMFWVLKTLDVDALGTLGEKRGKIRASL